MGDKINLTLQERVVHGKKVATLRKQGVVPGVVYGHGFDPVLVQAPHSSIEPVVRKAGKHTPVHIDIQGKKRIALIKEIERNATGVRIRHISLHAVNANEIVVAEIPIKLVGLGESEAEKAGLIILQDIEHIEVRAKPADLPESIELSVESLAEAGDRLTLADVSLPEGVKFADGEQDLDLVIANVYEPAALEAANEAAAGDATLGDDVPVEDDKVNDTAEKEA